MKKKDFSVLLLFVFVSIAHSAPSHASECDIDRGPCTAIAGRTEVTLDITPQPVKAMKELFFRVTVKGSQIKAPLLLKLSMPGMYMVRNEVVLKKMPDGSFSGRGIIPRCPSGKKLWQADIAIPSDGRVSYRFYVDH